MTLIQLPTYDHIEQIRSLNNRNLFENLTDAQKQNGFVRIAYDRNGLQQIIGNQEMVIATKNDEVVGYYLIGRKSGNAALDYQRNKAISLFGTHQIPFNKIGYGCQVCIEEAYRNNGLFGQMLSALNNLVENKYSYLLCSISADNINSRAKHIANGWYAINDIETPGFYLYNTHPQILQ